MESNECASSSGKVILITAAVLIAGVLAFGAISMTSRALDRYHRRQAVEQRARQLVSDVVLQAQQSVEKNAESFRQFILSKKSGSKSFAEDASSLYGKWRAAKPLIPGTDPDGHKKYIQEIFEKDVMSSAALGSQLRLPIQGATIDIEGIQNDLAVKLRSELDGYNIEGHDIAVAQEDFKASIQRLVAASQWDTTKAAANLAVSEVVSTVASQVLVRLGVQAGILAVGVADSWWTFGASVVIGFAVDAIWSWIDNPVGKIQNQVDQSLDKVANDGKAALLAEMSKLVEEKKTFWEEAATEMVKK